MTLAGHEVSHNLGFKNNRLANRLLGIASNIPMGVPSAVSFKRYHMEHHRYQGEDVVDVDVPGEFEAWLFQSRPGKAVWLLLQPFFYSLRPLFSNPKQPCKWEYINAAVVVTTNVAAFWLGGANALFYLIGGSLIGMGVHPAAGHFVAEHYVLNPGFETMSYYGPLNWFALNVGYHNEHHDFPNIPGARLHLLREIAPFPRVKRVTMDEEARKKLQARELEAHRR